MESKTYSFNYSQDIIHLQTKYALFKRVANILFSVTFDEGFDEGRMLDALQLLIDRNDCLRLTFGLPYNMGCWYSYVITIL